jgi:hypothetical protein
MPMVLIARMLRLAQLARQRRMKSRVEHPLFPFVIVGFAIP